MECVDDPKKFYRLKHKPTGLFYSKNTLSEKGKIYTSGNNYLTQTWFPNTLYIPRDGKLIKKYPFLADLDTTPEEERNKPWNHYIKIVVHKEDFEKDYPYA